MSTEYPIDIKTTSKPLAEYRTDEWGETDLPGPPAIMIGKEVVVEGSDVPDEKVIPEIRKKLGMPSLEPEKKGMLNRLFR